MYKAKWIIVLVSLFLVLSCTQPVINKYQSRLVFIVDTTTLHSANLYYVVCENECETESEFNETMAQYTQICQNNPNYVIMYYGRARPK